MTQRKVTLTMVITSNQRFATIEEQTSALIGYIAGEMGTTNVTAKAETYPEPPKSRADRICEAMDLIKQGRTIAEDLKDELDEWAGNLPDNFEDQRSEIENAVSELEDGISYAESAIDLFGRIEMLGAFGS